jgi:hypothetical protein
VSDAFPFSYQVLRHTKPYPAILPYGLFYFACQHPLHQIKTPVKKDVQSRQKLYPTVENYYAVKAELIRST